jgi:GNAT superfamily N-acetyltransferase
MKYRDMTADEAEAALALVMRSFDKFVRPDFSDEGAQEFARSAREFIVARPPGHHICVAERAGRLVGVIDVRDESHVCLFFVEPEELGRGIGRGLLDFALAGAEGGDGAAPSTTATVITVNSSPWAVPVYERLGFAVSGPLWELNGIRSVPMARPARRPA